MKPDPGGYESLRPLASAPLSVSCTNKVKQMLQRSSVPVAIETKDPRLRRIVVNRAVFVKQQ